MEIKDQVSSPKEKRSFTEEDISFVFQKMSKRYWDHTEVAGLEEKTAQIKLSMPENYKL